MSMPLNERPADLSRYFTPPGLGKRRRRAVGSLPPAAPAPARRECARGPSGGGGRHSPAKQQTPARIAPRNPNEESALARGISRKN
ncbi:unnamed protein product [Camellia sinensis]